MIHTNMLNITTDDITHWCVLQPVSDIADISYCSKELATSRYSQCHIYNS
jgi:hypothetical protein